MSWSGEYELERKIVERKKEADDKNISHKAIWIARFLGSGTWIEDGLRSEKKCFFYNDNFEIRYEDWTVISGDEGNPHYVLTIEYKSKTVYDDDKSYIPGDWEKELDELYAESIRAENKWNIKKRKEEKKIQLEKEKELKKKWGL